MQILGEMILGAQTRFGSAGRVQAIDPASGAAFGPDFGLATAADVDAACTLAAQAFDPYRALAPAARAAFLDAIADQILALGDALILRAMQETGLPRARLEGERARTMNQLRLFADVVRAGHCHGAIIDRALPERMPPRPDLRLRRIGLGPVAVFGASNFPLAFSVAGGDTAAALAAGCPVVVKGHGAHLGTSELVGRAVQQAARACAMPDGVFSLLFGAGSEIGQQLVAHPAIKAVGFTGSRGGGMALMRTAAARPEPIPVYAEMSSINPVFLLPGVLAGDSAALAAAFADSLTLGAGQFCTNPGLLLALDGPDLDRFAAAAAAALAAKDGATMLTPGIHAAYRAGIARLDALADVALLARGGAGSGACPAQPALYACSGDTFEATAALEAENFGPSAVLIRCRDFAQLQAIAARLEGQLTATVHMSEADLAPAQALLPILERKAGRILFNGFPTGVEVAHAMVHGGPFPATSDSRTTSVGATAIDRFLRPVCYQNAPAALLPPPLADANPWHLARLDGGALRLPQ